MNVPAPSTTTSLIPYDQKVEIVLQMATTCRELARQGPGGFGEAIKLSKMLQCLQEHMDSEIMDDLMVLCGSPLGFATDRDNLETKYPVSVVQAAIINAFLHEANIVGNEFNILAGKYYLTKEFFERKCRELVNDLRVTVYAPTLIGNSAYVPMKASWIYNGRRDHMDCIKSEEGDSRIIVKMNKGLGADAVIGKAQRRLLMRIYERVTGSSWLSQEDEDEVFDVDESSVVVNSTVTAHDLSASGATGPMEGTSAVESIQVRDSESTLNFDDEAEVEITANTTAQAAGGKDE